MFLSNVIKLSQTAWVIYPAQEFGFSGNNYIMKKVGVICLARDNPSDPYLCLYQILSKYFKSLRSYKVHKNLAKKYVQGR